MDVLVRDAMLTLEADTVEVTITHTYDRSWWQQWQDVVYHLDELRAAYQPGAVDSHTDMERRADNFLKAAWTLKDWLRNDGQITPRITARELDEHVRRSKALRICQAYANTAKHLVRSRPEELHARIREFSTSSKAGSRLSIAYWSSTDKPKHVDALELAEHCVADWQRFLEGHGLAAPR